MRIDKFLFFTRLIKSRTQAQALLDEGRTRIDGRRVEKPSDTVKPGSVVALPLRGQVRVIRVLGLPERRGPAPEAQTFYEEIAERAGVDGTTRPA
uniref:RNA-binding S4 domain-containing protein n=1 Tax=uncultured Sphingomonas sp. TaxID=158754 RepID=UPI0025CF86F0|nr:RNA-binding S4 domain-containing protein [uncultured Sphingomonas sp.]